MGLKCGDTLQFWARVSLLFAQVGGDGVNHSKCLNPEYNGILVCDG